MGIEIREKKDCCGCASCFNVCPRGCIGMEQDEEGFVYPVTDTEKCTDCGLCTHVCPMKETVRNTGDEPDAYACINLDEDIRMKSSSGGMFALFAKKILDRKGTVYGAAFRDDAKVSHIGIGTEDELWRLLGSKYLQSDISSLYKSIKRNLDNRKMVLFSGTPCQCAGLKKYLARDYDNLYLIDFICHGVPSPVVWEEYLKALELREGKQRDSRIPPAFRDKTKGWIHYMIKVPFRDAAAYHRKFGKDLYMRTFLKNIILRPSCYHCKFKPSTSISDITLGDFWGVQKCLPEMFDDKGTSAVLVNSPKGEELLKAVSGGAKLKKVTYGMIAGHNSSLCNSAQIPAMRKTFFENFHKDNILDLMKRCTKESLAKRCIKAGLAYVKK